MVGGRGKEMKTENNYLPEAYWISGKGMFRERQWQGEGVGVGVKKDQYVLYLAHINQLTTKLVQNGSVYEPD